MPILYRCSRCGYVIRRIDTTERMFWGVPTPSMIRSSNCVRCPNCGKELRDPEPGDVSVRWDV